MRLFDLPGLLGDDVVEARDDVASASGQSGIERRHDAERRQVGRLERQVVGDENPSNQRRVYVTSTDDRGPICC